MLEQEKKDLFVLEKNYEVSLRVLKSVIGKEEVEYLMEDKPIMLSVCYDNDGYLGRCINHIDYYEIEIYNKVLHSNYKKMREVIIHEIIHTFKNTTAHDGIWFYYADLISLYTSYNIKYAEYE